MVSLLTPFNMASDWKILEQRGAAANVRFGDLFKVCEAHFGHTANPVRATPFSRHRGKAILE